MSLRTFIYGSCVSRDTFERLPDEFELISYIARQSLVSAFTPPTSRALPHVETDSAFQRRMITGDWESSLVGQLREHADSIDVLLWDLCDERVGLRRLERVTQRPKMHAWATRSVDTIRTGVDAQLDHAPRVAFASATHRVLFLHAVRRFRLLLDDLGLLERTLLLAPAWATHTEDGVSVPTSFGLEPHRANRLFRDYHRTATRIAGVNTLTTEDVLADAHHAWGVAPFHYTESVYRSLSTGIVKAVRPRTVPAIRPSTPPAMPLSAVDRTGEGRADATVAALVKALILEPASVWTDHNAHMVDRQQVITTEFMARNALHDRHAVYDSVWECARSRSQDRPITYFVVNPGGAGSHWLQELMASSGNMNPCGEVYLPPAIMEAAAALDTYDRGLLLDAVHLLHSYRPLVEVPNAPLINTAHIRGWRQHDLMPDPKKLVLLTRDPLDVVLSRTFRKQAYRLRHFAGEDDETYLNRNITFVQDFYKRGERTTPDALVRYEELRDDAPGALGRLAQSLGVDLDCHQAPPPKGFGKRNKYAGPDVDIPPRLVSIAAHRLAGIRHDLGYCSSDHEAPI